MGSNLGIALLLGLVGAFAIYDYAIGTNYIFRPLVTGVLVGIVRIFRLILLPEVFWEPRLLSGWERIQELPWPWRFLFP